MAGQDEGSAASDPTALVAKICEYGEICDHCLGRLFGKRSTGLSNDQRGLALRIAWAITANEPFRPYQGGCFICHDLFDSIPQWADRVVEAATGFSYSTFLIGSRIPPLMAESEEMVWSDLALQDPETLKSEVNREVGKAVSALTGKTASFSRPELVAILDIGHDRVEIQANPVFFTGRYRKLERGIPQTHWDCRACRGAGCERCGGTGKQYQDSVEELIGRPVISLFHAEGAILHGAGREDIDALMVGTGRPFVMEVVSPRRRDIPLPELEAAINSSAQGRVEVAISGWSGREEVEIIKSSRMHKKYRILVEVDPAISADVLSNAANSLRGVVISQRTPERVAHRRADKIRERRVIDIRLVGGEEGAFVLEVTGEAGLYIKELVSGDLGRTRPSLAGILGVPARVKSLDVVEVGEGKSGEEMNGSS